MIQALLAESGKSMAVTGVVQTDAGDIEMAADNKDVQSPETYIGYRRAERFASPAGEERDRQHQYAIPSSLELNQWALSGQWLVHDERAELKSARGAIAYRFHARDLHLVLGPGSDGKPLRFRIRIDGAPPRADHGVDADSKGAGKITEQRLYQLVRQNHDVRDRTFEIESLIPARRPLPLRSDKGCSYAHK